VTANPDVVVIGAGFAGLSAATALAEAGRQVLVLDARPQLGGRATAFRDRVTGELVDNGQHVLFGCYHETFAFLRRIGADANVRLQPALAIPYLDRRGRRSMLRCPPLPAPLHLLAAVLDWDALPWRDRLSVLRLAAPLIAARRSLARNTAARIVEPNATVSTWLERHGQTAMLREWLWDPLAVAALNQSTEEAAAEPFVRVLAALFGPDPADSAVALPTRPLHLAYAEPARAYLEARNGEARTGALARIVVNDGGISAVETRTGRIAASRVIAAVPWFSLATLFAGGAPAALEPTIDNASRMQSKPIVTVNLWYDAPVMDEPFVGLPGRTMQWVFDKRFVFDEASSHLSIVSSGAEALAPMADDAVVAIARQEVEDALPRAAAARLTRATVIREKRATFSLAAGQPPRPGTRTPVPGLYLAGDWTDTGLPGTIESAVISGHRAARAAIEEG
jgi:hydroxysqualene dehydroxylase